MTRLAMNEKLACIPIWPVSEMGNFDVSATYSLPFFSWWEMAHHRITRYWGSSNTLLLVSHFGHFRSLLERAPSFSHLRSVCRRMRKCRTYLCLSRPRDLLDDSHLALFAIGAGFGRCREIALIAILLNFIDWFRLCLACGE